MAGAAVSLLLENVSQLLRLKADLVSGAENELQQLKNELRLLKSCLEAAAAKEPEMGAALREMERQIREAVYDADDNIASCLSRLAAKKSSPLSLSEELRSVGDKLKALSEMASTYSAQMQIGYGYSMSKEQPRRIVKKDELPRQHGVIGFEDEEERIIGYLLQQTRELDVISIVGMPGLGKTTLTRKIYESLQIKFDFPLRIWVCASQEFEMKDVLLTLLKQLTDEDMSSLNVQELAAKVRGYLEKEKFLLVVDDVWTREAWDYIKWVLPRTNSKGKVLITSRYTDVALHANPTRPPHCLRFLTYSETWELLQLGVFGQLEDCPFEELRHIGQSIATKCEGLALAVVVVGGILREQLSGGEAMNVIARKWYGVSQNLSNYLIRDERRGMRDIVAWSYRILADDLRDCFLYLGVFPEDYEIPAWTLTRLWIAEGFIQHQEGESLEETAEENLKDLVNRNLVMVEKTNPEGQIKACRVHDVIRAFCIYKAEELNLFREAKISSEGVFDPPTSGKPDCRRLCIHSHLSEFLSENLNGPHLRSLLCFYKEFFTLNPEYISVVSKAFNLLRVFESQSIKFPRFPMKFTKSLIHLRFISLSCDDLDVLPDTISELWNLQTIVLNTELPSLEVRANIWRMMQLRHLKTKAAVILAMQGGGNAGENLQTLSRLSAECCTEEVYSRARNLRKLGIQGRLAALFDTSGLEKLDRLEKLKLVNDMYSESASRYRLHSLPPPYRFPPNLKRLTLSATSLDWEHMSALGKNDTLEVLKLRKNAFRGLSWHEDGHGFRRLQFLLIADADLVSWETSSASFPSLRCLVLENCEQLKEIPMGLVKSLQKLDIEGVSKSVVESAKKIEREKRTDGWSRDRRGAHFELLLGPGCE